MKETKGEDEPPTPSDSCKKVDSQRCFPSIKLQIEPIVPRVEKTNKADSRVKLPDPWRRAPGEEEKRISLPIPLDGGGSQPVTCPLLVPKPNLQEVQLGYQECSRVKQSHVDLGLEHVREESRLLSGMAKCRNLRVEISQVHDEQEAPGTPESPQSQQPLWRLGESLQGQIHRWRRMGVSPQGQKDHWERVGKASTSSSVLLKRHILSNIETLVNLEKLKPEYRTAKIQKEFSREAVFRSAFISELVTEAILGCVGKESEGNIQLNCPTSRNVAEQDQAETSLEIQLYEENSKPVTDPLLLAKADPEKMEPESGDCSQTRGDIDCDHVGDESDAADDQSNSEE